MAVLDLDQLVEDGKKVYVKNTSRPMGHIVLTFVTPNGKPIPRPIPRTWIPICLTDTLAPNIIRDSNDLRQFISKGILALVDPVDALKSLQTPEGQEEQVRLNLSEFSNRAESTSRVTNLENQYTSEANVNNPMGPPEGQQVDPVNNRVKATLLRVESNDMTDRQAVADLRVMEAELTSHDLTYIISQVEEGSLKRYAFQVLSQQSAVVDPDVVVDDEPSEDPEAIAAGRASQKV